MMIETGDTVLHEPTGEKWPVACVEGDRLWWLGRTDETVAVEDCKLVKKATDAERRQLWKELASSSLTDYRKDYGQAMSRGLGQKG